MMNGAVDLLHSERGVFSIFALICATTLALFAGLTIDQWLDFAKYLVGFLVASKTITTAVETVVTKKPQIQTSPIPEATVVADKKE